MVLFLFCRDVLPKLNKEILLHLLISIFFALLEIIDTKTKVFIFTRFVFSVVLQLLCLPKYKLFKSRFTKHCYHWSSRLPAVVAKSIVAKSASTKGAVGIASFQAGTAHAH